MLSKNRVKDTTTTTGTGNLTLSGTAPTGFMNFNTAFGTGSGNTFPYVIDSSGGSEWEVGVGYLSASTTMVRSVILASSNSGSAVSLSAGTKNVRCTIAAEELPLKAVLTSNEVRNNTTTMTDTALSVSVAARRYKVEVGFYSIGEGGGATTFLKVDFGGTATLTSFRGLWEVASDASTANRVAAAGTDFALTGVYDFTDGYAKFVGTANFSAAGTFVLRAAQNTAEAADSIMYEGAFLELTPLF